MTTTPSTACYVDQAVSHVFFIEPQGPTELLCLPISVDGSVSLEEWYTVDFANIEADHALHCATVMARLAKKVGNPEAAAGAQACIERATADLEDPQEPRGLTITPEITDANFVNLPFTFATDMTGRLELPA